MSNIIVYIGIMLIVWFARLIALFIYPIVFLFRRNILNFAFKNIKEDFINHQYSIKKLPKWKIYINPLFWGFLFTTGFNSEYEGPVWYLKELKEKWKPYSKLQFFWLCYRWQGIRNGAWTFTEWFFREGTVTDVTIKYENTVEPLPLLIMPYAKFKDGNGEYRDNSGPYIRYSFDVDNKYQDWMCTHEGKKILIFKTYKKKERFEYALCKIIETKLFFLVLEIIFGWDWWDGNIIFHFKLMPKIRDYKAIADYRKYKRLYYK